MCKLSRTTRPLIKHNTISYNRMKVAMVMNYEYNLIGLYIYCLYLFALQEYILDTQLTKT